MPTKDPEKRREATRERVRRYRDRQKGVTEDVTPVTPSPDVTPFSVVSAIYTPASGDVEDNPIVAGLIKRGKVQKGVKIGHGLPFGKDRQVRGGCERSNGLCEERTINRSNKHRATRP